MSWPRMEQRAGLWPNSTAWSRRPPKSRLDPNSTARTMPGSPAHTVAWHSARVLRSILPYADDLSDARKREDAMTEKEKTEGANPQIVPPTQGQQQMTEVVVDDSGTLPSYSNFCRVT